MKYRPLNFLACSVVTALALPVAADAAAITVTIVINETQFANSANAPTNGMQWGLVVDSAGNGFAPSAGGISPITDVSTSNLTSRFSLNTGVTDDFYVTNSTASGRTAQGGPPTFAAGSISNAQFTLDDSLVGKKFGLIWWETNGLNGARYGFFSDNNTMVIPAAGSTSLSFASVIPDGPKAASLSVVPVPEPTAVGLMTIGALSLLGRRRKR